MGGWSGAEASKVSQSLCNDPLLHDTQMPNVVMREMIKGSVQFGTGSTKQVSAEYKGYWGYSSIYIMVAAAAKSLQSCPTLQPHRRQPTRIPVPGIPKARTLERVAISFSNA